LNRWTNLNFLFNSAFLKLWFLLNDLLLLLNLNNLLLLDLLLGLNDLLLGKDLLKSFNGEVLLLLFLLSWVNKWCWKRLLLIINRLTKRVVKVIFILQGWWEIFKSWSSYLNMGLLAMTSILEDFRNLVMHVLKLIVMNLLLLY
jgi:hypothetical protein